MRIKMIWHSNAPTAPTGYGQQSSLFTPRLAKHYDLAISAFYGLEGAPVMWNGIPMLPGLGGNFGNGYLHLHAERWFGGSPANGLIFWLGDSWVIDPQMASQMKMIVWTPVDHDPAPPKVKEFFQASGAIPIAMSHFGQEELADFKALYCPHAVDASIYKPPDSKDALKEMVGIPPNSFLIGMVAANKGRPSRKGFQYSLEAFRYFREKHENAYLYIHAGTNPDWAGGEHLTAMAMSLEIPGESLLFADQYRMYFDPYSPQQMSNIYGAMDVLLNPSMGGGFEIPILEASACGVPSITTDFTAMPQVAGPTPWKIKGRPFWTPQLSWNAMVDVGDILSALEDCYRMTDTERRGLAKKLRKHAEEYDVDTVMDTYMLPAIKKAERRFAHRTTQFDVTEALDLDFTVPEPEQDTPSISVITPWHNHEELATEYWKAIDGEKTHEVLVIDNGSEEPVERAAVRLEENAGFCHANNVGLEKATGEAVLFLNNDVALGVKGWLEPIRAALEPGVLVGANLHTDRPHTVIDGEPYPYIDGWLIAGMRADLQELGGWDETYDEPAYYSDNDLCLRAKRAGMQLREVNVPLIHLLNQTAGPPVGLVAEATRRNQKRFAAKVQEEVMVGAR